MLLLWISPCVIPRFLEVNYIVNSGAHWKASSGIWNVLGYIVGPSTAMLRGLKSSAISLRPLQMSQMLFGFSDVIWHVDMTCGQFHHTFATLSLNFTEVSPVNPITKTLAPIPITLGSKICLQIISVLYNIDFTLSRGRTHEAGCIRIVDKWSCFWYHQVLTCSVSWK